MRAAGVAVVTGASSGIGAEFARQLVNLHGWTVVAVGRDGARLEELRAATGRTGRLVPCKVDLSAAGAAESVAAQASVLGGATWLVNCAGVFRYADFGATSAEQMVELVRVNVEAPLLLTRALLPQLAQAKGAVLNVASLAGFMPAPSFAVYGATKGFLRLWSEALSIEVAPLGVSVTALCPGPVTTPIFDRGAAGVARRRVWHEMAPEEVVRLGIRAAAAGRAVVVPGAFNAATAVLVRLVPPALLRFITRHWAARYLGYAPGRAAGERG